jgi:hypothetical protein
MNNWSLANLARQPAHYEHASRAAAWHAEQQGWEPGSTEHRHEPERYFFLHRGYNQPEINSWEYYVTRASSGSRSRASRRRSPHIDQTRDFSQYIETVNDPTATVTYDQRYVFATINQTTVAANIRMNWAFTPNVSIQLYAQPLIASGDYTDYKELARPNSYDFLHYGQDGSTFDPATVTADPDGAGPAPPIPIGDQNFNFRSLRGNAVFRWEYRPGSAFFLVWTQQRTQSESIGDLELDHSVHELISAPPNNIYLAKLTWYFNL